MFCRELSKKKSQRYTKVEVQKELVQTQNLQKRIKDVCLKNLNE